jgi:hypothetical protein
VGRSGKSKLPKIRISPRPIFEQGIDRPEKQIGADANGKGTEHLEEQSSTQSIQAFEWLPKQTASTCVRALASRTVALPSINPIRPKPLIKK